MMTLGHAAAPLVIGTIEMGFVGLASALIFVFVGPKIWAQFKTDS